MIDWKMGVTQVINKNAIMQFNVGYSKATGYLNDPYKVVSRVDASTGVPLPLTFGLNALVYENRPDSRTKKSLFWATKYQFDYGDTLSISYRYMTDDWGVKSNTIDTNYRWNIILYGT